MPEIIHRDTGNSDALDPSALAVDDGDGATWKSQTFSEQSDKRSVGGSIHRRRSQADAQLAFFNSKRISASARRDANSHG